MARETIKANIRSRYARNPLVFAVPGSKVYVNQYYRNRPKSFINVSITGTACDLQCSHCRGHLLKSMAEAKTSDQLTGLVDRLGPQNLEGMLISGGFSKQGILCLDPVLEGIAQIKKEHPRLKVLVHTGFMDRAQARSLKGLGIDGVLTNLMASKKAIAEVYGLKGCTPEHFYETIRLLKQQKLKVIPHIIMGLGGPKLKKDFGAVKKAVALGADALVFVIVKKISASIDFQPPRVDQERIAALIGYARRLAPQLPLSFGCAKPPGKQTAALEQALIRLGIGAIAFPSQQTVAYAAQNGLPYVFRQSCCAL